MGDEDAVRRIPVDEKVVGCSWAGQVIIITTKRCVLVDGRSMRSPEVLTCAAIACGSELAVATSEGVKIWDRQQKIPKETVPVSECVELAHSDEGYWVAFQRDGGVSLVRDGRVFRRLEAMGDVLYCGVGKGEIRVFAGQRLRRWPRDDTKFDCFVSHFCVAAELAHVATLSEWRQYSLTGIFLRKVRDGVASLVAVAPGVVATETQLWDARSGLHAGDLPVPGRVAYGDGRALIYDESSVRVVTTVPRRTLATNLATTTGKGEEKAYALDPQTLSLAPGVATAEAPEDVRALVAKTRSPRLVAMAADCGLIALDQAALLLARLGADPTTRSALARHAAHATDLLLELRPAVARVRAQMDRPSLKRRRRPPSDYEVEFLDTS